MLPSDIEIVCIEINLRKQKWCIIGIYRPPNMNLRYFIDNLSMVIDSYSSKYDKLIIMGDFNVEPSHEIMENFLYSYSLYNLVKDKTCFKGLPKCYDLILTNCKHSFQNTITLTTGLSDFHKMTVTVLKTEFVKADPLQISYRNYNKYNSFRFNEELKIKLESSYQNFTDYDKFQTIFREVLDKHAPIKKKIIRANNSPFMTKNLRKLIMQRSRSKNTFYKNKTPENWEKYRVLRNECVKLTKKVKREYYENLDTKIVKDNKLFWKTVKPFFTNKGKQNTKIIIVENDKIVSENKEIAAIMNNHFINIANDNNITASDTANDNSENLDLLCIDPIEQIILRYASHPSILKIKGRTNTKTRFSFELVNATQIKKEIIQLNSKKSSGYDTIPPKALIDSTDTIKYPLANLFNTSIIECLFPKELKNANVSPVYKKGDKTNKENYRPISILPSISKIFERLMFQQISNFVTDIISPLLCGFRKGYSTQHALLRLLHKLNTHLDNNQLVGLLLIDLSKAFDCISYELLVAKLHAYGLGKNSLTLLYSYLKERSQRVKINADYSSWENILKGVPQGSVLGPLLFNLYINDLFYFVKESDVCNFADDNTLSVADIDIDSIITKLEKDTDTLLLWFQDNGMKLNDDKCKLMIMKPTWSSTTEPFTIRVGNDIIEEVDNSKLLGITLSNDASIDEHIKKICKEASKKLYALARISPFLCQQKRKILMKSFVISQFNYCPILWTFCQRKSNNLINRIHLRALRIAYNDYTSDFQSLILKDNSITIHQKNVLALTSEIFKTLNDLNPSFMKDIFSVKESNYNLRREYLKTQKPRTVKYGLQSFRYRGTQIWNSLPRYIQQSNEPTIKTYVADNFKSLCKCNICKKYIPHLGYLENQKS